MLPISTHIRLTFVHLICYHLKSLSHDAIGNIYRKELEDAIDAVEQLEEALA